MRLKATVFTTGAAVMIIEIIGSRLLAPFFGSSVFTWTSIIGVILASLSLGYWWGGRVADKNPREKNLALYILTAAMWTFATPILSTNIYGIGLRFGLLVGPIISAMISFSCASFYLGIVSPYAVKLASKSVGEVGRRAGSLYAVSTLGSICGTFMAGFVLVPAFNEREIMFGLSIVLALTALLQSDRIMVKLVLLTIAGFFVVNIVYTVDSPVNIVFRDSDIIFEATTPYQNVYVLDSKEDRVLTFGMLAQSRMSLATRKYVSSYLEFFHLAFAFEEGINKILFLGTGGGLSPREFREKYPEKIIDVVDIDPTVNQVAQEYFDFRVDANTRLHSKDARIFLKENNDRYDLIIVDLYNTYSIPFHTATREMFQLASDSMTDDGVLAMNVISSLEGRPSIILKSIVKTLKTVYPNVYVFHVNDKPDVVQNTIVVATKKKEKMSSSEITARAVQWGKNNNVKKLEAHSQTMITGEIEDTDAIILTDQYAPLDYFMTRIMSKGDKSDKKIVCLDMWCVIAEVVDTPDARAKGLMDRSGLGPDDGMLFIFETEQVYPFWMKNMRFPIDIIWISTDNRIVHIEQDVPACQTENCPSYTPKTSAKYVLEVSANYTLEKKIEEGMRVVMK